MVPLGIGALNLIARYRASEHSRFYTAPMIVPTVTTVEFHVAALLCALAGIITITYFAQLPFGRIPLVYMFTHPNDVDNLLQLREEAFKLFDPRWNSASSSGMFYAFLFLRTLLYPFLILLTWGYYLCTRERRWLVLAVGTLALAVSMPRRPLPGRRLPRL
jgi:hypothetical protein